MLILILATWDFTIAVFVALFAIGLSTRPSDSLYLMRHWQEGARVFAAIYVVVPAVVMLVCILLPMPPAVEVALVALSVSPMLPLLPNDLARMGARKRFAVSLEVMCVFMALIAMPIAFWILLNVQRIDLETATLPLIVSLLKVIVLPLGLGVAFNLAAPVLAARAARRLAAAAMLALLVGLLILLWLNRAQVPTTYSGPIFAAIVALVVSGLAAGHLLGGSDPSERGALALTAASRHIGFAIGVGSAVAPRAIAPVAGTILIYFLVRGVLVMPYRKWAVRMAQPQAAGP